MKNSLWYKNALFYEVHVRAFCDSNGDGNGDLKGLESRLGYIRDLGVDCIWLLPIYPSPLKDDGYDISDFYNIHPMYGTLDDFEDLLEKAHRLGLKVITDLVLNHTSDQHPWFQAARSDPNSPYHQYYTWSDTDQKYSETRIIFTDTEKSNWTWDEKTGKYYWHRFYSCQPDLNYRNPAVQSEILNIIKYWLDLGVDGFRADAVPYLFEREGTSSENLPETHLFLKKIRKFIDDNYPNRVLLCEANQWPQDVREYFGNGDEFHMGFHFPLMPRIFMSMRKSNRSPLVWVTEQTPDIPENCQWCTFLRNHDELTLEMVTEEDRQWMWQEYAPNPRMRLNLGIRRRLSPLLDNDHRKIELAYSLLLTLPGSPVIYYGDEIGMGDNIWLEDRNGVRTPMQWDDSKNAGFSSANKERLFAPLIDDPEYNPGQVSVQNQINDPESLLNKIKHMITVRKQHEAFCRNIFSWVDFNNDQVASYTRKNGDETLLILNNLSGEEQTVDLKNGNIKLDTYSILINGKESINIKNQILSLEPYQFIWLII